MARVARPWADAWRAFGETVDRLPLPLLLAAPAVVLCLIAALLPESLRLGYTVDLEIYRRYAVQVFAGLTPYRDVPIEYPPLALVPMLLPLLGPRPEAVDLATYTWRFVAVAAALAVAVSGLTWQATGSRRAVALGGLLVVLSWVSAVFRYDLWPTLAMAAGVLVAGRRPGLAGLALGAGTMLKLFPAAVVPVVAGAALVRRDWPATGRLTVGFGLVVVSVAAWAWALAGPGSLDWLRYQGERGLQLESSGASLLLALHAIAGLPVERNYDFGAVQIVAPGSAQLAAAAPWLQAGLLAAAIGLAVRRFRRDRQRLGTIPIGSVALAAVAAIAAPLLAGKVLSMQYVLWLLPLAPLLRPRLAVLAVVLAASTTAVYTAEYVALLQFTTPAIALLVARNLLLAAFVGALALELWTGPAGPAADPRAGPATAMHDLAAPAGRRAPGTAGAPASMLRASNLTPPGPRPRSRRPER